MGAGQGNQDKEMQSRVSAGGWGGGKGQRREAEDISTQPGRGKSTGLTCYAETLQSHKCPGAQELWCFASWGSQRPRASQPVSKEHGSPVSPRHRPP